ncbi:Ferritin-like metal-binding protein YciE [Prosthecobacter debontii]|uniref:Ferritin-like metal-binding protein YciE n=1 Tax=Prosthecobacter debontii TaxID=48467 RepID=A0A1T4WY85_9BACT|nr:DUF892 family protein [Prosthecobacter debontii]SKA82274.1 Ferritin-like metal-binding protein YciE [Prosthecobacter debontii]
MKTLQDLYLHELQVLCSAEMQIKNALPRIIKAASCPDLKAALKSHYQLTQKHLGRLSEVLRNHSVTPQDQTCEGIYGLLQEWKNLQIEEGDDAVVRDLDIIAKCQRVKHYEIASYGSARAYAEQLGHYDDVALLTETLEEESGMDDELTSASIILLCDSSRVPKVNVVNPRAGSGYDSLGHTPLVAL